MPKSISVNDIIVRLQNTMGKGNKELSDAIGGAVDVDTILDNTSIAPMSFHVAYAGSSPKEEYVNANEEIVITKQFAIYVVLDMEKFNGRLPQSMVPIIEQQLINALWCWDFDLIDANNHGPMMYGGDNVEYLDRGRYVHSFLFNVEYTVQYSEIGVEIYNDGDIALFDTLFADYFVGTDSEGNEIYNHQEIYNIYNEGEPLN